MVENAIGQVYNTGLGLFQAPVSGSWTSYDIGMVEQAVSTGIFRGDFPGVAAGVYSYIIRLQAGASPAVTDAVLGACERFYWDGTQVVTAAQLLLAARSEPAQGAPAEDEPPITKLDYLYKNWRNKKTQTSNTWRLFNDDAATVDQQATVSDDGTTTTKGEVATG